jgi:chromate reductase, NAD(P)H dehydrogenase (quinone)
MAPIHLLGISGSLRQASTNTGLLRYAAAHLPPGVTLEVADLRPIPFFDADLERQGDPPGVAALKRAIRSADGLLIATPEYNLSLTGVLKNAIDWATRPYKASVVRGKPVAMMGAGGVGGTKRAQEHLRTILGLFGAAMVDDPVVAVARNWEKFDEHGDLTDTESKAAVDALVQGLVEMIVAQGLEVAPAAE